MKQAVVSSALLELAVWLEMREQLVCGQPMFVSGSGMDSIEW